MEIQLIRQKQSLNGSNELEKIVFDYFQKKMKAFHYFGKI